MSKPVRRRTGFTLLELLVVVTIIAILATVAIAKFGESKRRAYLTAMKSDLHGLATIAETQFATENSYQSVVAPQASDGVTLTFLGSSSGWSATATHAAVPGVTCAIASGSSLAAGAVTEAACQ